MKHTLTLIVLLSIVGCTRTEFSRTAPGAWKLKRSSFLQKLEIPDLAISSNNVTMKGYANDGGNQALGIAVSAAVEAAVKGAKP